VLFEKQAEIEHRFAQYLFGTEHKGDEQSADPAVAVKKRVNRFELCVDETSPHQKRKRGCILVDEGF